MSEAAVTTAKQPQSVRDFLALPAYKERFSEVLGKRAPQFLASISNAVTQTPALARCEPRSVIAAAFIAASLDLPIDKNLGVSWIIPYGQQATFQLGYRGFVQLALRSGAYARMNACPVNAEAFGGYDEVGEPVINWDKLDETKPAAGYAASWRLTNGFVKVVYWTKEKVEVHAKRFSQAYRGNKKDSPWFTDFDAMAVKTVLKAGLSRWGILSIDMQKAIIHDQGAQKDIDAEVVPVDNIGLFEQAGEGGIADALGGDQKAKPAASVGDKQTLLDLIGNIMLDDLPMNEAQVITMARGRGHSIPDKIKSISELPVDVLEDTLRALKEVVKTRNQTST